MIKKLTILIIGILLVSGAIAGVLSNWNNEIELTQTQENQIKVSGNVDIINVKVNQITCDNKKCWAKVYQSGIINAMWMNDKSYCSKWSENCLDQKPFSSPCSETCLKYADYTIEELQEQVSEYVESKLGNWADAEINRSSGEEIVKTNIGTITNK